MSLRDRPFSVAVVGGGIGGLFAALFLHFYCGDFVSIKIYEQAKEYKEIGAGIGLGVNASALMDKIGIYDSALELSGFRNGIVMCLRRYDTGHEIYSVPAVEQGKLRHLSVVRPELLDFLIDWIKKRGAATLVTDRKCVGLQENGDRMTLGFRSGPSTTVDLVIGADGIHSFVRAQYITDVAHYSGRVAYRCVCPIDKVRSWWPFSSYAANWLSPDRHFITYPMGLTKDGENKFLNAVALIDTPKETLESTDRESWTLSTKRENVMNAVEGFEKTVRMVVENIDADPVKSMLHDREPVEQWIFAHGKVLLLGDAAHAMLPHSGQGGGQAIEDGYILSRALQDYFSGDYDLSLREWLQIYQSTRLPRAQKLQDTSRELGWIYEMQTDELKGKPYEECLPIIREQIKGRMRDIWLEDIDASYEHVRTQAGGIKSHS